MSATKTEENRRILVVDDNAAIHEDYRKILCGERYDSELDELAVEIFGQSQSASLPAPRYEVDSAYQGQEGFEMVRESIRRGQPYAMAFVDMRMPPGWDGLKTIGHLWEADPNLNVVICSAYSDYEWSDVVAKLGTNDRWLVLKKPFDNAEVCQLAAALTEKRKLTAIIQARMLELESEVVLRTADVRERDERFKAILDTAPDGIVTLNEKGTIETINAAAAVLFQESQQNTVGRSIAELTATEDHGQFVSKFVAREKTDEQRAINCVSRRSDGTLFPSRWTIGEFRHASKTCFTAIIRDESERERLCRDLTQAQKLEAVGQLAAGIAHEINTPAHFVGENVRFLEDAFAEHDQVLTSLRSLLDACGANELVNDEVAAARNAIEEGDLDYLGKEIPKTISQTLNGIERITKIVTAMKDFSHPGTGVKVLCNIHDSLESTITVAQNEWKYVADIERDYEDNLPLVPCLIGELDQVFINLIVNAAHSIGDVVRESGINKGKITIGTRTHHDFVEIFIKDTGAGIPRSIQTRLFDPFFTTKEVGKGTGQGLSIAHSIVVDKHQGRIELDSELGKGSIFSIQLPLRAEATICRESNAGLTTNVESLR